MLPNLSDTTQTISFSEGDGVSSAELFANNVVVTTNAGSHNHGSSKVKLKNLVDYNWECKFYPGRLIAIHMSGDYLAYAIKAPNTANPGSWSGMVRVVYNVEADIDRRALIKGMKGEVHDLSFAHIENQAVLACIDEHGNFYIYNIDVTDIGLRCSLLAEVTEDTGLGGGAHRVVWCPYIPDADDEPDEDVARLLLTTHHNTARIWNMREVTAALAADGVERTTRASAWARPPGGAEGGAGPGAGAGQGAGSAGGVGGGGGGGVLCASEHAAAIVAAAFSPDGTALATAAADSYVMFFQVYMHNEASPRCLHKWQPHAGKPLSCLFFLDNHNNYNSDVQFWKFAVTGAENNSVLKIWSCKSWSCVQTISFLPTLGTEPSSGLRAALDASAGYLLLSDSKARSLYVLHMARDRDDTVAYCKSISEFLLPYPVLSFCIVDAGEQQGLCSSGCSDPYHRNGSSGDVASPSHDLDLLQEEPIVCGPAPLGPAPSGPAPSAPPGGSSRHVLVRLYIVQPKGLQQGELVYTPPLPNDNRGLSEISLTEQPGEAPAAIASSILQQQSQQLKNLLMRNQTQPGSLIGQRQESPTSIAPPLNLMTPDAFSSPGKREEDDPPLSLTPVDVTSKRASTSGFASEEPEGVIHKLTSGGSSPSREVQEIMSLNDSHHYYKEDLTDDASQSPVAAPALETSPGPTAPYEEEYPTATTAAPAVVVAPSPASLPGPPSLPAMPTVPAVVPTVPAMPASKEWPQISIEQLNTANQRDKSASSHNSSVASEAAQDRLKIDEMTRKLDALTELVRGQSRELAALRGSLSSPAELVERTLHAHAQRTAAALDNALREGWERILVASESAGGRAAAAAGTAAARALEPLAMALQHELAAKLSATDTLLRENIEKLANSKSVVERLSTSVAGALAETARGVLRDALLAGVLPAMEKAHAQLFRQINQAFQAGTKEFAANTEAAARVAAERGGSSAAAALRAALDRHAALLRAAAAQPTAPAPAPAPAPPPSPQVAALWRDTAREVLEKELSWWRSEARGVLETSRRSPATPAGSHVSVADRQLQVSQIKSLIESGDVNSAFQLALSASDLSLVTAACRYAEPTSVARLKQHVLLSLLQQLAAEMTTHTQLKLRFIEESIMNLDTTNPVTREHLPIVIRELQKQIMAFINSNPQNPLLRDFRMLLMATESLTKGNV